MKNNHLVIIPTYNEAGNILKLIKKIFSLNVSVDILVIDDNSPDGTGQLVKKCLSKYKSHLHLMNREKKMGLGTAYLSGYKFAIENKYDYIIGMDADFSHDPYDIPRFIEKMADCDLVVGSRYIDGIRILNWPLHRFLLSTAANLYYRTLSGVPLTDQTTAYKCIRREALESIDLKHFYAKGYSFLFELNYKIWRKGFKIEEIPIIFSERKIGKTKLTHWILLEALTIVWRLKFSGFLKRM